MRKTEFASSYPLPRFMNEGAKNTFNRGSNLQVKHGAYIHARIFEKQVEYQH